MNEAFFMPYYKQGFIKVLQRILKGFTKDLQRFVKICRFAVFLSVNGKFLRNYAKIYADS